MATEYVLVYPRLPRRNSGDVLLVLKDKPEWQRGRLNLVGGKVEDGETPQQAAIRELAEETGFSIEHQMIESISYPILCGQIIGGPSGTNDCIVHCLRCDIFCHMNVNQVPTVTPREGETETVSWEHWHVAKDDPRLIPNLRMVVPLLEFNVHGWSIVDQDSSVDNVHKVSLHLNISEPFVNSGK